MSRKLIVGAAAVVLLVSAAHAYQGGAVILDKKDKLADTDPGYKPDVNNLGPKLKDEKFAAKFLQFINGHPHKVYTVKFKKGDKVVIQMKSQDMDSVVVVETAKKMILDLNDDDPAGNTLDSKLEFTAPDDGEYRIIATNLDKKYGDFQLTVNKAK
jgi:hypothetical protein